MNGDHNGGVFNPMNLNIYGYCYGNPVIFVDPNGKQILKTEGERKLWDGSSSSLTNWDFFGVQAEGSFEYEPLEGQGSIKMMTGQLENNTGGGSLPLALDVNASAAAVQAEGSLKLGGEKTYGEASGTGKIWSAEGTANAGIMTGEGGKYGLIFDLNGGAAAARANGEITGSILGLKATANVGVAFGNAEGGLTLGAYYDSSSGNVIVTGAERLGLIVGENVSVSIEVPVDDYTKTVSDWFTSEE